MAYVPTEPVITTAACLVCQTVRERTAFAQMIVRLARPTRCETVYLR